METGSSALKYINLCTIPASQINRYVDERMHIQIKARHVILNASYEFQSVH